MIGPLATQDDGGNIFCAICFCCGVGKACDAYGCDSLINKWHKQGLTATPLALSISLA